MDLLLVRHATAEDGRPGRSDADRRLTAEGRREFLRALAGLRRLDPEPTRILTSPLVRARETAELLAEQVAGPEPEEWPLLAPGGSLEGILRDLRGAGETVVLVGHEPGLGRLVSLCLAGAAGDNTPLKKGGMARIRFDGAPRPGRGRLVWLLTPGLLRRIG